MEPNYPPEEDLHFGPGRLGSVNPGVATGPDQKYPAMVFEGAGLETKIHDPEGYVSVAWSTEQGAFWVTWFAWKPEDGDDPNLKGLKAIASVTQNYLMDTMQGGGKLEDAIDYVLESFEHDPIQAVDLAEYEEHFDTYAQRIPGRLPRPSCATSPRAWETRGRLRCTISYTCPGASG